jgi:vacuolar protein sorting-associated protein VTA1
MPAMKIPTELKKITPYVRRAEELDRDKTNPESRLVAYYCRQYAVHTGIPLAVSDAGKTSLGQLLGNLEGEKQAMDAFTRDEAKFLCTKFANKIFDNADLEDRTGEASKNTARVFYAAGSFLDILQQFYRDDDQSEELVEIKKKSKYAKWKAADILKALNEGRKPTPGGFGEDMDNEEDEDEDVPHEAPTTSVDKHSDAIGPSDPSPKTPTVESDTDLTINEDDEVKNTSPILPPPSMDENDEEGTEVELGPPPPAYPGPSLAAAPVPPPSVHKPPLTFKPPPPATKPMPPPSRKDDFDDLTPKAALPKPKKNSFFGFGNNSKKASKAELADATELTRFALAALEDKDADLAADRLEQALRVLGRH